MNNYCFVAEPELDGMRLDKGILMVTGEEFSRSYLQKIIKDNGVTVNSMPKKASYNISEGDVIAFEIPDNMVPDILPQDIKLDILYEDNDVIVINKPKNMVVHPAPGHYSDTLVNGLMYHCKGSLSGINGVLRPGIVHRIDKDTTGSIIACKNDVAHQGIAKQLMDHSLTRKYRAICVGNIDEDDITIDGAIGRDTKDRKKMCIRPDGKRAVTHVHVLERFKGYTYVECVLETGRTHQIRVHMSSINRPILGDTVYGNAKCPFKLEGQCLHAYILGFIHPVNGEYIETVAQLPQYFEDLLKVLR